MTQQAGFRPSLLGRKRQKTESVRTKDTSDSLLFLLTCGVSLKELKQKIKNGVDINECSIEHGINTPLILTITMLNKKLDNPVSDVGYSIEELNDIIIILLKKGADTSAQKGEALCRLVSNQHTNKELVDFFLGYDKGKNINTKSFSYGNSPLMFVHPSRIDIAELLIHNGADINFQNENGETPLFELFCEKMENIMDNAPHFSTSAKQFSAIKMNLYKESVNKYAKFLIENNANINITNNNGISPLLKFLSPSSIKLINEDLINLLIEAGADLHIKDKKGNNIFSQLNSLKTYIKNNRHLHNNTTLSQTIQNITKTLHNNILFSAIDDSPTYSI